MGGAERQLANLAKGLAARGHEVSVAALREGGEFEAELVTAGIAVLNVRARGPVWSPGAVWRLLSALRRCRPELVYSFMPVPNVLAALLCPVAGRWRLFWGVRASSIGNDALDWRDRFVDTMQRWFARVPERIVCNSRAGRDHLIAKGFPPANVVVVPNGIDTNVFSPRPDLRCALRREWGVGDADILVGIVGRIDPLKDHATFLGAGALAAKRVPSLRLVVVGSGDQALRDRLRGLAEELGIGDRVVWAGARGDMPAVYSALDLLCLSSTTEGFPNVIGEAMACGTPCVGTDVGDVAWIIGRDDRVAPPGDQGALAACMNSAIGEGAARQAREIRERVVENFSINSLCDAVEQLLVDPGPQSASIGEASAR